MGRGGLAGRVPFMRGRGPFADLIEQRFRKARDRLGFEGWRELDCTKFRVPTPQGSLF